MEPEAEAEAAVVEPFSVLGEAEDVAEEWREELAEAQRDHAAAVRSAAAVPEAASADAEVAFDVRDCLFCACLCDSFSAFQSVGLISTAAKQFPISTDLRYFKDKTLQKEKQVTMDLFCGLCVCRNGTKE